MGIAMPTAQLGQWISGAATRRPGTACTRPTRGACCGICSWPKSRGAASVRGWDSGLRPLTWTTSWTTAETGRCSPTRGICKAFATATTAKRQQKPSKAGAISSAGDKKTGEDLGAPALVVSPAWILATLPPGFEVFGGRLGTAARPSTQIFLPIGPSGRRRRRCRDRDSPWTY